MALGVLLPRVGSLRLLELCPSLVEQLVWAVGVRGNVSGQATTLLLQFFKAISTEVSHLRVFVFVSCSLFVFWTSRGRKIVFRFTFSFRLLDKPWSLFSESSHFCFPSAGQPLVNFVIISFSSMF